MFTNLPLYVNSAGLMFDIAGAWLVAWEVVQQYNGEKYRLSKGDEEPMWSTEGEPIAEEHQDYKFYQSRKYTKMKWGLACLSVGFGLQFLSNLLQAVLF